MKKKRHKASVKDWIYGIGLSAAYVVFVAWIGSWWALVFTPLIFDAYVTRRINWGWWKDIENPVTRTVMSWIDAIVFALVAVYFVNIYFFQNYTIPSSSLEKSLLVGDYLFVSKTSYGPRGPITPLSMPLCQHTLPWGNIKSYIAWPQWEYKRTDAKPVALNDIVVFNFPAGDSVALAPRYAGSDYYQMCYLYGLQLSAQMGEASAADSLTPTEERAYFARIRELGRRYLADNEAEVGRIGWRPVDRRENYVKRCVGLPGQTLEIRNRIVYLDGEPNKEPDNVQYNYIVELLQRGLPEEVVRELGLSGEDYLSLYQTGICPLTQSMREALEARPDLVGSITPMESAETVQLYPLNKQTGWTCDNYGPIWIPKKGASVDLRLDNLPFYERPIRIYEGNDLSVDEATGTISINGKPATSYTFKMDYYWMMGDNRHNSADSRYWGFVPEDHVVGKPIMIWMSLNKDYGLFDGKVRWNRLFRWVDNIK